MKNETKTIEIINEFPTILYNIKSMLNQENVDYILDAGDYLQPVALITIANPDMLLLNMKLTNKAAIDLVSSVMQDSQNIDRGMITNNTNAYYKSLCGTYESDYHIERSLGLDSIPGSIASQQMN